VSELVEVRAVLQISAFVECPNDACGHHIDLMEDDGVHYYNEEGQIIQQACPDNVLWSDHHKKFECKGVVCPECKAEFNAKGLDW